MNKAADPVRDRQPVDAFQFLPREHRVGRHQDGYDGRDVGANQARQVFMESKNSALFLVLRSLSSRKSMASIVPIGLRIRRSTYIFFRT